MDASGLVVPKIDDDEEKVLKGLLDAFGTVLSPEEIATTYYEAGRNADLAGHKLCNMQGSISASATNSTQIDASNELCTEVSCGNFSERFVQAKGSTGSSKQKWHPISVGTVSTVIDKDYVRAKGLVNGPSVAAKPLKLDSKVLPVSEVFGENARLDASEDERMHQDMEDFLFKMLGDGFQLSRDVIRKVLGTCGYDMGKSMDKLFDLSAAASKSGRNSFGNSMKLRDAYPKSEIRPYQKKMQNVDCSGGVSGTDKGEFLRKQRDRNNLQGEVLAALFSNSERQTEPTGPVKIVERPKAFGHVVVGPPEDFTLQDKIDVADSQQDTNEDVKDLDEEGSYEVLRRAVEEYRATMRAYYKAAVDAFDNGDNARAGKLLEKGHFFCQKAREADEESYLKIIETGHKDIEDFMLLDLHDHEAKEAIRLLKRHLSSLAGIPTFNYLKVIIDTNGEDISKGARRRLVMKLLEKESIRWTEEGNGGTIVIPLININPKHLSFYKK